MKRLVYSFSEGNKDMKDLLGGKGANLAEMTNLGLPVPPGFTITTLACAQFEKDGGILSDSLKNEVLSALQQVESFTGKGFGNSKNPLLFSVRSGAKVSMPGMMDTVLNLGLNEDTVQGISKGSGDERFAWDSYRRFIQMYSNVVMGFNSAILESTLEDLKEAKNIKEDWELTAEDLKTLVTSFKKIILEDSGQKFPTDPFEQLWNTIASVFNSWKNPRAKKYRELHKIPHVWGTAVNVQSMVFGNLGENSATGVCFSRDPSNGQKRFFGEYLIKAQGEDVVAGIRTPAPLNDASKNDSNAYLRSLEELFPASYAELTNFYQKLETHYKDIQDIEFTIELGKLYILQTRNAKRTPHAAIKIAVDMVTEGLKSKEDALMAVNPEDLNQLLHPRLDPNCIKTLLAKGLPASPGAAAGQLVFNSEDAAAKKEKGIKVLLVRRETSPEDIGGMIASEGILTSRGGMTSHAAVVARGMGKPCVVGCTSLFIDHGSKRLTVNGKNFYEGDFLTIEGALGEVYEGIVPTVDAEVFPEFSVFMGWADEKRRLKVRVNADSPQDCEVALKFGAQGIGLCRTEHMFFAPERILAIREMIFANDINERTKALEKLLPYQREDFIGIFERMNNFPVNIRLLDPPLHEFLPQTAEEVQTLASSLGLSSEQIKQRSDQLFEFNPMLGHRGCRLGISFPEIYNMQITAIMEAAINCFKNGFQVLPEIMFPLVSMKDELEILRKNALNEIEKIFQKSGIRINYKIGTMIEVPRAALIAGELAQVADFFSFGTNDLTQTTFGLSRDDAGKFLHHYQGLGLFTSDPFVSLDQKGVGFLVEYATKTGREKNSNIHIGICGEHGGEPKSIHFCHKANLDYVSCSPYRVPIARLAAAQAAIIQG